MEAAQRTANQLPQAQPVYLESTLQGTKNIFLVV
jgi:hypothetical protein